MFLRKIFYSLLFCSFLPLSAAHWKIFFYIDCSDELSHMAIKNITDMMRGKPNDTVEFLIQMHAYFDAGLRYQVTDKGLMFLEEITLTNNSKQDFINAAKWGLAQHAHAEHTMLIIANHGWGILDPEWDEEIKEWKASHDSLSNTCMIKRCHLEECAQQHANHRGFFFNRNPRTYLNNQDLIDGLAYIKNDLLHGKQLDVIAFDTCMGDMLEIGYQFAPYVKYLVGSQSCSILDGFDYQEVISVLNQKNAPRDVVKEMVHAFDAYYSKHDESGIYTHAALDLSQIQKVKNALDDIVVQLLKQPAFSPLILKACHAGPRFCLWPMYTDLIAFCKNIESELAALQTSAEIISLQKALQTFYEQANNLVVARCGGKTTQGLAHGFAIYLPRIAVDASYYQTVFAKESQWVKLLEVACTMQTENKN